MEITYLLIIVSVPLLILIAWAFIWAVRSGQFDDLEKPRHQILMDDDNTEVSSSKAGRTDDGGEDQRLQ